MLARLRWLGEATPVAGTRLYDEATASLAVPVVAEHGLTDFVWSNAAEVEPPSDQAAFRAAYFFASRDIPFTQFVIPESLPGGDSEFEIIIGEYERYPLQAGIPFDFTTYFPNGVTAFLLSGFGAAEGLVAGRSFPYTHGFRFAEEGGTVVLHGPMTPGDFTLGGLVDGDDLAIWHESFGVDDSGDADGDGDSDGEDFLSWQRQLDSDSALAVSTNVPEPSVWSLALIAACGVRAIFPRRQAVRN